MDQTIIFIGVSAVCTVSMLFMVYFGKRQTYREEEVLNSVQANEKQKQCLEKFDEPVNKTRKVDDLHLLKNVSSEHIQLLVQDEIFTIKQLRDKIRTKQDARSYSKKLGIYKNLVEDWVRLGGFSKLHGITQEYIDLLKLNGINTIMDLQNQDPNVLYYQCVRTHNRNAPTLGMIKHWIRASKNINHSLIDNKISVSS